MGWKAQDGKQCYFKLDLFEGKSVVLAYLKAFAICQFFYFSFSSLVQKDLNGFRKKKEYVKLCQYNQIESVPDSAL